jgi:predicted metalloprotease
MSLTSAVEQRVRWFRRGFDTGDLDACDTFSSHDARGL